MHGPPHHGAKPRPPRRCPPRAFEILLLALITHCPIDLLIPHKFYTYTQFIPYLAPQPTTTAAPSYIYDFIFSLPTPSLASQPN